MTREELRDQVIANLGQHGLEADIRIQPDPFTGWRVAVISDAFASLDPFERRRLALAGIDAEEIETSEFLTSAETEWTGALLKDSDLEDLPTWPDALSRDGEIAGRPSPAFASESDEDLVRPVRVTFYSVRGGVGRTTALAYTARILAEKGYKVVCVDLDLEAPGLATLFGVDGKIQRRTGVVEALLAIDRGDEIDLSQHLIRVDQKTDLYCIAAGLPDANYARLLQFINPSVWYTEERNPLREFVDLLGKSLPFVPDVILFDSRTGISEISAPLLFDVADLAVVVFFPHPQTKMPTCEVVHGLISSKNWRILEGRRLSPEPRFLVSPLPSSRSSEVVQRYRARSSEWVSEWLSSSKGLSEGAVERLSDGIHFVSYSEDIATSDASLRDSNSWREYEPVADWIERLLPTETEVNAVGAPEFSKDRVLDELNFSTGTAEQQLDFLSTFVEVDSIRKALALDYPVVLGRKGVGKTAIFRRFLEGGTLHSVPITTPQLLKNNRPWILGSEGFEAVNELLVEYKAEWRTFWKLLVVIAHHYADEVTSRDLILDGLRFPKGLHSTRELIALFESLLQLRMPGLEADDYLETLDLRSGSAIVLLFDGLDTGFGNSPADQERRRNALAGLFEFILERLGSRNIKFKVVLREDIWRSVRFQNKSHFFGRTITLDWKDQTSFYKIVLKQALRSKAFRDLVSSANRRLRIDDLGIWDEQDVITAWNLLIGERMKGEKTARTRNWVWNRLADANEDHSPRYLLQLFHQVLEWERAESKATTYTRSILRPRALSESLPGVSTQALDALANEEFPELSPLLGRLREIGRTPVASEELMGRVDEELVALALEVGVLGIYEGTEERVERYRVPEIYRYALNMTRKGQA